MKELTLRYKVLGFSIEFKDLLGTNLDLATLPLSYFCHFSAIVWEIGEI